MMLVVMFMLLMVIMTMAVTMTMSLALLPVSYCLLPLVMMMFFHNDTFSRLFQVSNLTS